MCKFIKKLFCHSKVEDRKVNGEVLAVRESPKTKVNPNFQFAFILFNTKFAKEYKCVSDFISEYKDDVLKVDVKPDYPTERTPEIEAFVKKYKFLKCKSEDTTFNDFIVNF